MSRGGAALGLLLLCACGGPRPATAPEEVPELIGVWYTVRKGDTVEGIAKANAVAVEDVVELNDLHDPDRIEPGQRLFLYGIEELVRRLPPEPRKRAKPAPTLAWPLTEGVVSSGFGKRWGRLHKGIDIAAPDGTVVRAAADGEVVYSDDKQRGYGNLVILRHAGGVVTVYAHNSRNLVDEGQTVRQGSPIAEVGSSGNSTGPHLHFEVRLDGEARDPLLHLPAR